LANKIHPIKQQKGHIKGGNVSCAAQTYPQAAAHVDQADGDADEREGEYQRADNNANHRRVNAASRPVDRAICTTNPQNNPLQHQMARQRSQPSLLPIPFVHYIHEGVSCAANAQHVLRMHSYKHVLFNDVPRQCLDEICVLNYT
jgi:hypothetical protein